MSNAAPPFAFSQFVPGFDFLKNLAGNASAAAATPGMPGVVPGMQGFANWVAPTLSIEEVDKRIQELKTVQYWLEQNGHALKATIQALEVQKMTLSTLRGMNVRMEDIAGAFTRQAEAPAPAPAAAAAPQQSDATGAQEASAGQAQQRGGKPASARSGAAKNAAPGVVDPMQWWGALTEQFQQIAGTALHDAAQLKMPALPKQPAGKPTAAPQKTKRSPASPASKAAGSAAAPRKKPSTASATSRRAAGRH